MGVLDGQPVNQAITNPAFINKNVDDTMPNQLGFGRALSGPSVADIQQAVNNIYTASGVSESNSGTDYNGPPNTINNGDNYQTALSFLADKFAGATGHNHNGTDGNGPIIAAVGSIAASGYSPLTGAVLIAGASGAQTSQVGQVIFVSATGHVDSIAASGNPPLTGNVVLVAGTNVNLSQVGQNITISASGGSGGISATGTDGQVLKAMAATAFFSSYYNPYPNYIGNAFAELDTAGWATYADAAANIPVDGTGGTATGLTFSRSTSSPLRDTGSFLIAQANSTSLQGKGVSYNFTIDSADQAKALSIQMDYNASATFIASNGVTPPLNDNTTTTNAGNSDIEVFVYDVTNAILIPVSPEVFTSNGSNNFTFKGTFQSSYNSTSYRLILHCATTSANATGYQFKFTNVFVGPQYITQGPPTTPWVQYTPTFVGLGTPSSVAFFSRRVGDSLEISGILTQGIATAVANQMSIGFNGSNANVTIDSAKVSSTMICGDATISVVSAASYSMLMTGGNTYIQLSVQSATLAGTNALVGGVGTGTIITFFARVPISGWSSNTLLSNDAKTRVVAARILGDPASASSGNPVIFPTISYDTLGVYNASTGRYTVPTSGLYRVHGYITSANTAVQLSIYVNAVSIVNVGSTDSNGECAYTGTVQVVAGDLIDLRPNNTLDAATGSALHFEMIQGPSQIAIIDSVNARYFASATSISGSLATVVWTTKDYDSHSQMSSGLYTITISGKYQINTALLINATFAVTNSNILEIQKNSSVVSRSTVNAGGVQGSVKVLTVDQLNCIAGDVIRVQVSSAGTSPTIASSNFDNYFSIFRTGN